MMRPLAVSVLVACCLVAPSCAWANRDNRPVWNAFEENLVPQDDGWFYAALPLTVPLGLGAVLVDTFVAHPIQVVDDAVDDAGKLWEDDDLEFEEAYYTEVAYLPFRAAFTPLVFAGSFVGRSLFDVDAKTQQTEWTEEREAEWLREIEAARVTLFTRWLEDLETRPDAALNGGVPELDTVLETQLLRLLAQGDALRRIAIHTGMLDNGGAVYGRYSAASGLSDPDPVVRFSVLQAWPAGREIPPAQLERLRNDPNEAVRAAAQRR